MSVKITAIPATKFKPGGWLVRVISHGEEVKERFRGVTKQEATAMVPQLVAECEQKSKARRTADKHGIAVNKTRRTYADACDRYQRSKELDGKKLLAGFERAKKKWGQWYLDEMDALAVREWALELYPDKPKSANKQCVAVVSAVYNDAAKEDWCQPKFFRKFKEEKVKGRKAVTVEYLQHLSAQFLSMPGKFDGMFELVSMGASYGTRVDELMRLRWEWTDLNNRTTWLPKTKTTDEITINLTDDTVTMLRQMKQRQKLLAGLPSDHPLKPHHRTRERFENGLVFGWVHSTSIYDRFKDAAKAAKLPYVTPHQVMRHTFATRLAQLGWSAEDIIETGRWSNGSARMLRDVYIHIEDRSREAAEALEKSAPILYRPGGSRAIGG